MALSRRERLRQTTLEEIKATARQQMADKGTAEISLRGIAEQMGMTAPAIYRYFPSRDDLITALVADAFNALADALEAADAALPDDNYAGRLLVWVMMYRQWALEHPTDFQLIYGNPIPGYHAPRDVTVPIVIRGFAVVIGALAEAQAAGKLTLASDPASLPADVIATMQETIERDGYPITADLYYRGIVSWTRIHGIIMLELFNHLPPVVGNVDAFYRHEVETLLHDLGLTNQAG